MTDAGEEPRPWWRGDDDKTGQPAQTPELADDGRPQPSLSLPPYRAADYDAWPYQGAPGYDAGHPWRDMADGYAPFPRRRTGRALGLFAGLGGLLAIAVAGGFAVHALTTGDRTAAASLSPVTPPSAGGNGSAPSSGSGSGTGDGVSPGTGSSGTGPSGGLPYYGSSGGSTPSGSSSGPSGTGPSDTAAIASRVDPGLVDINTSIDYGEAQAAGTGMVLATDGTVLTNNHVIDGATTISVTDVGNGRTYQASVVGYSVASDVAVLQLAGAAGLQTVTTAGAAASIGEQVVGIGNAGGAGGTPSYAGGTVTATGQSITASDELTGSAEQLTGMIETNAGIQPGDSGGPLVNDSGQVVGMDTAGSESFQFSSAAQGDGYAIPIATATSLASQIVAGNSSSSVHVGPTAFLGVQVGQSGSGGFGRGYGYGYGGYGSAPGSGVPVAGVVAGSPAAGAGLIAGDVVTSLGGYAVTSASVLQQVLTADLSPGQTVTVQYTDSTGQQQSVTLTLVSGPPA